VAGIARARASPQGAEEGMLKGIAIGLREHGSGCDGGCIFYLRRQKQGGPGRARRSCCFFAPPPPCAPACGTPWSPQSGCPESERSRSMLLTACFRCAVKCSSPFGCGVRSTSTTSSCPLPSTAPGPRGTPTSTTAPGNHQALCRMGEFGSLAPGLELVLSLGVL
jgi:hypothetical protein